MTRRNVRYRCRTVVLTRVLYRYSKVNRDIVMYSNGGARWGVAKALHADAYLCKAMVKLLNAT